MRKRRKGKGRGKKGEIGEKKESSENRVRNEVRRRKESSNKVCEKVRNSKGSKI